jgi:hypothetical protein
MNKFLAVILAMSVSFLFSQENKDKLSFTVYDGVFVGGYVNNGAYLNFTGPNINVSYKYSKLILGMLPSLRFKKDYGITKNAFLTPNLGLGLTYCYKMCALQMPIYYNPKTIVENGKWHLGIGVGLRINEFNTKK